MTIFGTMDNKGEVTKDLEIDLNNIPSSDPMAFGYGIAQGQKYLKGGSYYTNFKDMHGSNYSEIAQEYLRGCKFGATGMLLPEGFKIPKGCEFNYFGIGERINKD